MVLSIIFLSLVSKPFWLLPISSTPLGLYGPGNQVLLGIYCPGSNLVTTFGWNEHGMCGTGNETNVHSPHTVESLRDFDAVLVGAGAGHCFVVARRHRTGETSPCS